MPSKVFHLAGIVPIISQESEFELPWHDCLMPINSNFHAVERAVAECAHAGCETVWIVSEYPIQPLLRKVLGNFALDPVELKRHRFYRDKANRDRRRKYIPIYYVSLPTIDNLYKKSIVWSLMYGARAAKRASNQVSNFLIPHKYYAAFPYSIYDYKEVLKYRLPISSVNRRFVFRNQEGLSFKDGVFAGFTFSNKDLRLMIRSFRDKISDETINPVEYKDDDIPIENRYSGRFINLNEITDSIVMGETVAVNLNWYYWCDNWDKYCEFIKSGNILEKPTEIFMPKSKLLKKLQ